MNFNPLHLYDPVTFPVARGTPMLSSLVQWDHSHSWSTPDPEVFIQGGAGGTASCVFSIDTSVDSEDRYLVGHKIDGRVLYPATGYLVLAWQTLAKIVGQPWRELPIAFEDVHIHRATILPETSKCYLFGTGQ